MVCLYDLGKQGVVDVVRHKPNQTFFCGPASHVPEIFHEHLSSYLCSNPPSERYLLPITSISKRRSDHFLLTVQGLTFGNVYNLQTFTVQPIKRAGVVILLASDATLPDIPTAWHQWVYNENNTVVPYQFEPVVQTYHPGPTTFHFDIWNTPSLADFLYLI